MPLLLCNKRPGGILNTVYDFLPFRKWFLICLCCWLIICIMTDGWLEKEKAKQKRLPFWASRSRKCQWNGYFAEILKEQCASRSLQQWTSGHINCVVWHTSDVCYMCVTHFVKQNKPRDYWLLRLVKWTNNITSLLGTEYMKGCIITYSSNHNGVLSCWCTLLS